MSGYADSTRVLQLCYTLLNCRPRLSAGTTSNRSYDHSALAQLVEQLTVNQRVAGSSPAGGAIFYVILSLRADTHLAFRSTKRYVVTFPL